MRRLARAWAEGITALSLFIEGLVTRSSGARRPPRDDVVPPGQRRRSVTK